jgi:hypothetical protein
MALPWIHLVKLAPQIISLSRELLNRSRASNPAEESERTASPDDLAERITELEENERRQAELVDRMAQQQAELSRAVLTLHKRQRWLMGGIAVLAVALLWQFVPL